MCCGHAVYKMESNHIQIVTRDKGSLELALEIKKKKDRDFHIFCHTHVHFVHVPGSAIHDFSVNVLGLDK